MSSVTTNSAAALSPSQFGSQRIADRAALAFLGSMFVAAAAHLTVPLPFTPVPLTFSDLAVLLVGLALGPATGFAALVMYLIEGACGMPVFAPSSMTGLEHLRSVTAGYLLSYPFAAALAGALFGRLLRVVRSPFLAALPAALTGSILLMVCGTAWLGIFLHLHAGQAFTLGALPFLPGQVIKVVAAAGIMRALPRLGRS